MSNKERVLRRIDEAYKRMKKAESEGDTEMFCYYHGQVCGMKSVLRLLGINIED